MGDYYTGIGSRSISENEKDILIEVGKYLASKGFILRSGKADGADSAFAIGAYLGKGGIHNYTPWKKFKSKGFIYNEFDIPLDSVDEQLQEFCKYEACRVHRAWNKCSQGAKKMHTRNILQVIGHEGKATSRLCLACSDEDEGGDVLGGTRTAWTLAKEKGVPVFNVRGKTLEETLSWIDTTLASQIV